MKVRKIVCNNSTIMFKSAEITKDGDLEIIFDVSVYEQANTFSILNERGRDRKTFMIIDHKMLELSFLASNGFNSITYHIE